MPPPIPPAYRHPQPAASRRRRPRAASPTGAAGQPPARQPTPSSPSQPSGRQLPPVKPQPRARPQPPTPTAAEAGRAGRLRRLCPQGRGLACRVSRLAPAATPGKHRRRGLRAGRAIGRVRSRRRAQPRSRRANRPVRDAAEARRRRASRAASPHPAHARASAVVRLGLSARAAL